MASYDAAIILCQTLGGGAGEPGGGGRGLRSSTSQLNLSRF